MIGEQMSPQPEPPRDTYARPSASRPHLAVDEPSERHTGASRAIPPCPNAERSAPTLSQWPIYRTIVGLPPARRRRIGSPLRTISRPPNLQGSFRAAEAGLEAGRLQTAVSHFLVVRDRASELATPRLLERRTSLPDRPGIPWAFGKHLQEQGMFGFRMPVNQPPSATNSEPVE